ncbi:MAG TPA: mechanosensitive ion channel family protein [Pseudomonadales bacterium]|nr:mechanosensitive ion channel family protein [Pseudomonadales bacterium]
MDPTRWLDAVVVVVAFLAVAAVSARTTQYRNPARLRRIGFVAAAYLIAVAVANLASSEALAETAEVAGHIAFVLGWWTVIEIVAIVVFGLALPAAGSGVPSIVGDLAFGAAILLLVIAGMRRFGVEPTSIVATSAVVTGILALSLQTTLGNVIGGVALQLDRSVRVGDWIQLENGRQGRVTEIHWRHTVIETRDWDTIIVPNSSLLAANIIILGKREGEPVQHRMWVYFNVDFRFPPARVIDAVDQALARGAPIPGVALTPAPNCVCMDFSNDLRESYARYAVRYWLTDLLRDDPTSSLMRGRIHSALARADIPLAIPATQVFMETDADRRAKKQAKAMSERLAMLRAVEFLRMLNDEEMERLAAGLRPAPFVAGDVITRQGAEAHWLYLLAEGEVVVEITQGAQTRRVATIEAPGFFGEMGLMTGEPRRATVSAVTAVQCFRLDSAAFREILENRPGIVSEISAILAERQVGLQSARADLDERSQSAMVAEESERLLTRISEFFGLG